MSPTFNDTEGRRVVAADTAEDLGEVKGFVVDRSASRVDAVHVSGRGRKADVIAWSSISSFGDDAVIVTSAEAAERVAEDRDKAAVKGKIVLRGARVLTTGGFEIGTVEDASFDQESGEITGVRTDQGSITGDRLRSIGSYALVVDPA